MLRHERWHPRAPLHVVVAGVLVTCIAAAAAGQVAPSAPGDVARIERGGAPRRPMHAGEYTLESSTIDLTMSAEGSTGAAQPRRFLSSLRSPSAGPQRRLVAVPNCAGAEVERITLKYGSRADLVLDPDRFPGIARVESIVKIRDQTIAVLEIDPAVAVAVSGPGDPPSAVSIAVRPVDGFGPVSLNAGPFTRVCERAVLNYKPEGPERLLWTPPAGNTSIPGTAVQCFSVAECAQAEIDILYVVAEKFFFAPAVTALAAHHSAYLGLNVGIVSTTVLDTLTPDALRTFIQDVYDTRSAEHFGDGHLAFVLLIGDAYEDDNQTVMIPAYEGYGGDEVPSDHYYACVSGDDSLEDVMLGRLSVGSYDELVAVVSKAANYMPHGAGADWDDKVLLVGGLFYTEKETYVELFDEFDAIIPDDHNVDRIYRHDFASDAACGAAVIDAINDGRLIVNFAGHGWIFTWDDVLTAADIASMNNPTRLPIALSMACNTGAFDNITYADGSGSYDCLAEQLVNTPDKGAIACVAAPRNSDGGMFSTLNKMLHSAIFEEHCVFIGESVAVAKLLHLQEGGDVAYARHFNLIGDPTLIFTWEHKPMEMPDLAIKPRLVTSSNDIPAVGDEVLLSVPVFNRSPGIIENVQVSVTGTLYDDQPLDFLMPSIPAWSSDTLEIAVQGIVLGTNSVVVTVDPDDVIAEQDEDNNVFATDIYGYPYVEGFPIELGEGAFSPCVARVNSAGAAVFVTDEDGRLRAIGPDGSSLWQTGTATTPILLGAELAPAAGDLDGDGTAEIITVKRMGVKAIEDDGAVRWSTYVEDVVGCPVMADADGDADLDVILATRNVYISRSSIKAVAGDGSGLWSYLLPAGPYVSTHPAVGDFDSNGLSDVAIGTSGGDVVAVSCAAIPPTSLWDPVDLGDEAIRALALADVDADGHLELLAGAAGIFAVNAEDGTIQWSLPLASAVVSLALADVDADGRPEAIAGTASDTLYLVDSGAIVWTKELSGVPGTSAAVGDLDDDGTLEILVGTEAGFLHVIEADGSDFLPPMPIPGGIARTPCVADIDSDGCLEVVVGSSGGYLSAFRFAASGADPTVEWSGLGANPSHSGVYAQPLSGDITSDLLLANRNVVTEDLAVTEGATLRLAPEATLEFLPDTQPSLEVRGQLVALGAPSREVVMKGGPDTGATWKGIDARPGAVVSLTSCSVSGAVTALLGEGAVIDLDHCDLSGNRGGAHLTACTLDAHALVVASCDSFGVTLSGGSGTITASQFDQNRACGLECNDVASLAVVASSFTGTVDGHGFVCSGLSSATIDSCTFDGNDRHGALISNSSPVFEVCTFVGNGEYGVYCKKSARPNVNRSTISGNEIGIYSDSGSMPNFGNDRFPVSPGTGYNSIAGNTTAAAANYSKYPLLAKRNWWGEAPPGSDLFIGSVQYTPWLVAPPQKLPTEVEDGELPMAFGLAQNTPNPFNPATSICYDVPAPGAEIDVSVFDVAGRFVAVLTSGHHGPGTYRATWDGRDEEGRRVASGTYFVRMQGPDFTAARKLILLK